MTQMVGLAVLIFMVGVSFMFWLGGIAANKQEASAEEGTDGADGAGQVDAGAKGPIDV